MTTVFGSDQDGHYHPALQLQDDQEFGWSAYTTQDLPVNTEVVSCCYDFAITPALARSLLKLPQTLNDRQVSAAFLLLCRHNPEDSALQRWRTYVASLPAAAQMWTPLFFTAAEMDLLRATNMPAAVDERLALWKSEFEQLLLTPQVANLNLAFQDYVWACTVLSSRAFPSSLIDGDEANAKPVLFPGLDLLNHDPARRVLWQRQESKLSVIIEEPVEKGKQVFNNYGPKSNEELFLGYGFVIPDNASDILALRLASSASPTDLSSLDSGKLLEEYQQLKQTRHIIGRNGIIPEKLLAQIRLQVADEDELQQIVAKVQSGESVETALKFISWDNELNTLDQLQALLGAKLQTLSLGAEHQSAAATSIAASIGKHDIATARAGEVRPRAKQMIEIYRQGQIDIAQNALVTAEEMFEHAYDQMEQAE